MAHPNRVCTIRGSVPLRSMFIAPPSMPTLASMLPRSLRDISSYLTDNKSDANIPNQQEARSTRTSWRHNNRDYVCSDLTDAQAWVILNESMRKAQASNEPSVTRPFPSGYWEPHYHMNLWYIQRFLDQLDPIDKWPVNEQSFFISFVYGKTKGFKEDLRCIYPEEIDGNLEDAEDRGARALILRGEFKRAVEDRR